MVSNLSRPRKKMTIANITLALLNGSKPLSFFQCGLLRIVRGGEKPSKEDLEILNTFLETELAQIQNRDAQVRNYYSLISRLTKAPVKKRK